jgi:putative transcriptional regulator
MADNEKIWSYEFEKNKGIAAGQLLLSEPFMFDENFKRTVVLVCSHDEENGTVGLIVNKPINIRLNDVIEDFPPFKAKIYLGGPVGTDTIQFLHSLGDEMEGSVKLTDHVYWGGDFEQLKSMITKGTVKQEDVRFYLGYSGWSSEQLMQEMKDNSWIIAKANYKHIFQSDIQSLWKEVMKNMGGIYNTMSNYPESPMLN